MFSLSELNTGFSYLSTLLAILVIARLWREKLQAIYRAFMALLVFDVVATLVTLAIPYHTNWYGRVWMFGEAIKLLLYAAVTLELYDVALRPYPGILRAAQKVIRGSLVIATLLTLFTLQIDLSHIQLWDQKVLPYFFAVQRTFILTLAVFQILVLLFLSWFQIRLSWNARVYSTLYITFFTFKSMAMLSLIMLGRERTKLLSFAVIVVNCACDVGWALMLKESGEDVETRASITGRRTDPLALTAKLEALNDRLSETGKKNKK